MLFLGGDTHVRTPADLVLGSYCVLFILFLNRCMLNRMITKMLSRDLEPNDVLTVSVVACCCPAPSPAGTPPSGELRLWSSNGKVFHFNIHIMHECLEPPDRDVHACVVKIGLYSGG